MDRGILDVQIAGQCLDSWTEVVQTSRAPMQNAVRHVLIVDPDPQTVAHGAASLAGMDVEAVTTPVAG